MCSGVKQELSFSINNIPFESTIGYPAVRLPVVGDLWFWLFCYESNGAGVRLGFIPQFTGLQRSSHCFLLPMIDLRNCDGPAPDKEKDRQLVTTLLFSLPKNGWRLH